MVTGCLPNVAEFVVKNHFQVISLRIAPDPHSFLATGRPLAGNTCSRRIQFRSLDTYAVPAIIRTIPTLDTSEDLWQKQCRA